MANTKSERNYLSPTSTLKLVDFLRSYAGDPERNGKSTRNAAAEALSKLCGQVVTPAHIKRWEPEVPGISFSGSETGPLATAMQQFSALNAAVAALDERVKKLEQRQRQLPLGE